MKHLYYTAVLSFLCFASGLSGQILISEIMYNPPEFGQDSLEYIELHNNYRANINLKGYTFTAGVTYTFGDTILPGGSDIVVAVNSHAMQSVFGISTLQWTSGGLRNSGETIALADADGNAIDSVTYSNSGVWPAVAYGKGHSLELCNTGRDNGLGQNWKASSTATKSEINGYVLYGSPGSPNNVSCAEHIIELRNFAFNPAELTIKVGETVEWQNKEGRHNVDGKKNVYPDNPVGFYSGDPKAGDWSFAFRFDSVGDYSYRCDPHFQRGMTGTIHVVNDQAPSLVINEIMYNPPGKSDDSLEYIELYNAGDTAIQIGGIHFTSGIEATLPDSLLPAHSYLVVAKNDTAFEHVFNTKAIQWTFGSLSNSGESIELSTALNTVIDKVYYHNQGDWPASANGQGASLVLCDPLSNNNTGAAWGTEAEASGGAIGGVDLYTSAGYENTCDSGVDSLPLYRIDALRSIDAVGLPDSLGVECRVRGVVYGVDLQKGARVQFTLYDRSVNMGMGVFGTDKNRYEVTEGDSVEVTGKVGFFNGLTQMNITEVKVLGNNSPLVEPLEVDSLGEYTESRLILLKDVEIIDPSKWKGDGSFFTVQLQGDDDKRYTMYIDDAVDLSQMDRAPEGPLNVTGIGSQFDPSEPHNSGYQIAPRYYKDIEILWSTNNSHASPEVILYPNPANTQVVLLSGKRIKQIQILNAIGRVCGKRVGDDIKQVDVSSLPTGIYAMRCRFENGQVRVKKFLRIE